MLASYRRVFSHPGALAFSATGLVARLPIAMMTLGIVLLVSELTGSYALAGQVSAAYIIGNAAFAIPHGRLADRFGQGRVLYVDAVVFALATGLLVVSLTEEWATAWTYLWAVISGAAIPMIGTMVRARWAELLESDQERHTAFAVEGVVDEAVFVTGPVLVTVLSTTVSPQLGLLCAIGFGSIGAVALALQRSTEPPAHPHTPGSTRVPMHWSALLPVAACAVALGSVFGALEVATVAFAEQEGAKAFSGVMLAAFAFASLLAGVVTGAVAWRSTSLQRTRVGMTLLALATLALPLLPDLVPVTVALFASGLTLAPTLIALFSLLESVTPRSRLNEAMGFVQTGVGAGIAPGAWLAGVLADEVSGSAAYWVCTVSAAAAALITLLIRDGSRRTGRQARMPPPGTISTDDAGLHG